MSTAPQDQAAKAKGEGATPRDDDQSTAGSNETGDLVEPTPSLGSSGGSSGDSMRMGSVRSEGGTRNHALDWFRSLFIWAVVFAHSTMILGVPTPDVVMDDAALPPQYHLPLDTIGYQPTMTNSSVTPPGAGGSTAWRWLSLGRQIGLPMLFHISGMSLYYASSRGWSAVAYKLVGITCMGCLSNALIFVVGPRDNLCGYPQRASAECQHKGLISYMLEPTSSAAHNIFYQFWYTALLILFIAMDFPLFDLLVGKGSGLKMVLRQLAWSAVVVLCMVLSQTELPEEDQWKKGIALGWIPLYILGDVAFAYCSWRCTTSAHPRNVRLWQYAAAACIVVTWGLPDPPAIRSALGAQEFYNLIFKHITALGVLMAITRKKAGKALSHIWPVSVVLMVLFLGSTNWVSTGYFSYPWFRGTTNRLLFISGTLVFIFMVDNVGKLQETLPLPPSIGQGTLLSYTFHPLLIVLILSVVPEQSAFVLSWMTVLIFTGLVHLGSWLKGPKKRRSARCPTSSDVQDLNTHITCQEQC